MKWAARTLTKLFLLGSLLSVQCNIKGDKNSSDKTDSTNSNKPDTSANNKNLVIHDTLATIKTEVTGSLKVARNKLTVELLKKIKTIEVLTIDKENRRIASTGEDFGERCEKWDLDKTSIAKIIKVSKEITGHEWHYLYNVIPCYYYGEVKINNQIFSFSINGGSFLNISNADTSFLYGCPDKKFEKYFLSPVWDPDSEQ